MAITKIDFPTASTPSYTPSISTDYNNQNEYIERNARGYNAITLTNWDATTTKPQVAAGSVIEINGSTYDITTATDIDTSGATSGTIYLYFDDGTPEFKFLDTAPTWSATLNGWYLSGDRFTGHIMEWDASVVYDGKRYQTNTESFIFNAYDGTPYISEVLHDLGYITPTSTTKQSVVIASTGGSETIDEVMFDCSGVINLKHAWINDDFGLDATRTLEEKHSGVVVFTETGSIAQNSTANETNTGITVKAGVPYIYKCVSTGSGGWSSTISVNWQWSINKHGSMWAR